jgi:hypothetical protein
MPVARAPRGARLIGAIVIAVALVLPAAAPAAPSATVTLSNVHLTASWKEGWLTANLHFTVTAHGATNVTAVVRPVKPGRPAAAQHISFTSASSKNATLKLPPRLPPGEYVLSAADAKSTFTVPTPAEGVVDTATISKTKGGASAKSVSGPHELWVRFHFLIAPPGAKTVKIEWRTPSFTFVGAVTKPYATTIDSNLASSSPLPTGTWYAILMVDGKIAKRQDVHVT